MYCKKCDKQKPILDFPEHSEVCNECITKERIEKVNSYGFYKAKYVHSTGKPYKHGTRKENWYSKTQCKDMGRPVLENEEPVAYAQAWNGYYALYQRD